MNDDMLYQSSVCFFLSISNILVEFDCFESCVQFMEATYQIINFLQLFLIYTQML